MQQFDAILNAAPRSRTHSCINNLFGVWQTTTMVIGDGGCSGGGARVCFLLSATSAISSRAHARAAACLRMRTSKMRARARLADGSRRTAKGAKHFRSRARARLFSSSRRRRKNNDAAAAAAVAAASAIAVDASSSSRLIDDDCGKRWRAHLRCARTADRRCARKSKSRPRCFWAAG